MVHRSVVPQQTLDAVWSAPRDLRCLLTGNAASEAKLQTTPPGDEGLGKCAGWYVRLVLAGVRNGLGCQEEDCTLLVTDGGPLYFFCGS